MSKRQLHIESLFDLCDSLLLISFIEQLSGLEFRSKYNPKPSLRVQKIENLSIVLSHLASFYDIRLVNCGPEDIVDRNEKMLLSLLYCLYVKFNIRALETEGGLKAEEVLLDWVRRTTSPYASIEITTYAASFLDGRAFLALVAAFVDDKDQFDYDKLVASEPVETIEAAFKGAAAHMGIPRMIDAKIVAAGKLDERSLVLIVASFFHAFQVFEKQREQERRLKEIQTELKRKTMILEEAEAELLKRARAIEDASQELERTKRELANQKAKVPPSEIWAEYLKDPKGALPSITIPFSIEDSTKKFTSYHIKVTLGAKIWVVSRRSSVFLSSLFLFYSTFKFLV